MPPIPPVPPVPPVPPTGPQPWAEGPAEPTDGWQAAYLRTRRRLRILAVTTVVVALLAVGMGAWSIAQATSSPTTAAGRVSGNGGLNGQGGPNGLSGQGGPDGLGGQSQGQGQGQEGLGGSGGSSGGGNSGQNRGGGITDLLTQLFNSDGSVNSDAVQQLLQQFGSGNGSAAQALPMLVRRAVESGLITQAQADALLAALGANTGSGGTTGQSGTTGPNGTTGQSGTNGNGAWAPPSQGRTGASGA